MNIFLILSLITNLILAGFIGFKTFYATNVLPKDKYLLNNHDFVSTINNSFSIQSIVFSGKFNGVNNNTINVLGLDNKEYQVPYKQDLSIDKIIITDGKQSSNKLTLTDLQKIPFKTSIILYMNYDSAGILKVTTIHIF